MMVPDISEPEARPLPATDLRDAGTVSRVAKLLCIAAESDGPFTLTSIIERTNLSPATVHRLLDLLMREGLIAKDEMRRTYRVGTELSRIAALVSSTTPFRQVVGPILREACAKFDETCYFALYLPAKGRLIYADKADTSHELGYRFELNRPLSLVWGSSGRVVMAYLPAQRAEQILSRETERNHEGRKPPSWAELKRELAAIRERGYAHSRGQRVPNAVGVIAPVFDHTNQIYGSLGYTIPDSRFAAFDLNELARSAMYYAARLSHALGATATPRAATSN